MRFVGEKKPTLSKPKLREALASQLKRLWDNGGDLRLEKQMCAQNRVQLGPDEQQQQQPPEESDALSEDERLMQRLVADAPPEPEQQQEEHEQFCEL